MNWTEEEYQNLMLRKPHNRVLKKISWERNSKKKTKKKNKRDEYDLQCQVAEWIMKQYPKLLWSASCGGMRVSMGVAMKMKRMGYQNGCPDIMVFEEKHGVHGLFVEMKATKGKQSDEQKEWERKAIYNNYHYFIAYSFDEAKSIINAYLRS